MLIANKYRIQNIPKRSEDLASYKAMVLKSVWKLPNASTNLTIWNDRTCWSWFNILNFPNSLPHYVCLVIYCQLPKKTCSFEATKQLLTFISNYAEEHVLVLPGRVPGFKRTDVRLLPSHMSKASVWCVYSTAMEAQSQTPIGYSKFVDLWNQLTPHVVIMRPMSDLCFTCQHNNTQIVRSANLPECAKSAVIIFASVKTHQGRFNVSIMLSLKK